MTFCCTKMNEEAINSKEYDKLDHSIRYNNSWRYYSIPFVIIGRENEMSTLINYCPFCGTKLPLDLSDKWFAVLEEEYGITDPQDTEYDKVPSEFRTDEWWKKRGL